MPDRLTDQLEQWGRARAGDLSRAAPAPSDDFLRGLRRVRRARQLRAVAGAAAALALALGATLFLRHGAVQPPPSGAPSTHSVTATTTDSLGRPFSALSLRLCNADRPLDELRLPDVSLSWTRQPVPIW